MGCCGSSSNKKSQKTSNTEFEKHLSPMDLLKIRLAKGEITFEEYEKTKAVLVQ
jgi:uncharacterized membrane protein